METCNGKYGKISIFLIFVSLLLGPLSFAYGLEITVKQSVSIKGDTVRLGDVAQFDPANDSRVSQLKNVEISASPSPGSSSNLNKDLLLYKVNPYLSGNKDVLIKVPENLVISRSAQFFTADRMKEIFVEYIKNNSEWTEEQIRFEDINTPGAVALPEGKLAWEIGDNSNNNLIGNVSLLIDFRVDGKLVKKVPVSGKVSVLSDTIKAANKIERGRIITEDDITVVSESSVHGLKNLIVNKEDIIGKRAVRTIQANQIIQSNMAENPPLVKKGDRITIAAENSELKITASGEALQDGKKGDQVEVLNLQSGKKIFATVKGSGLVEVFF
jgi:flagellar basal body P-ring formation protein FlgA